MCIKIYKKSKRLINLLIFLKKEFGIENIRFNGSSSLKLPNTCNVSFLHSQNLRGYAVLGNAKILEASTGSW